MDITHNCAFPTERRYFITITLQNTLNKPINEYRLFHKHMEESSWLQILVAGGYNTKHSRADSLISIIKYSFSSSEIGQLWSCLSYVEVVRTTLFFLYLETL